MLHSVLLILQVKCFDVPNGLIDGLCPLFHLRLKCSSLPVSESPDDPWHGCLKELRPWTTSTTWWSRWRWGLSKNHKTGQKQGASGKSNDHSFIHQLKMEPIPTVFVDQSIIGPVQSGQLCYFLLKEEAGLYGENTCTHRENMHIYTDAWSTCYKGRMLTTMSLWDPWWLSWEMSVCNLNSSATLLYLQLTQIDKKVQ